MTKITLIIVGLVAATIGVLIVLLKSKNKKIINLSSEIKAKEQKIASQTAQIVEAKAKVQEVLNVQTELKRVQTETKAPEKVESPASGDVNSRIERFNKL